MNNSPIVENSFYHIYNRGNNGENLFYTHENYNYFLRKYNEYLSPYLETYAYCLLPNHFHILVRVKENLPPLHTGTKVYSETEQIISEAFRRFFTSYAKSINIQEERTGSLFQKPFKRKVVDNEAYFSTLVHYIHANPQRHRLINDFREYLYSSYGRMLLDKSSKLLKSEVIDWFGSKENYIAFHSEMQQYNDIQGLIIEDDEF